MISAYLVAAGPWFMPALVLIAAALCWLALWLMGKGGWWRVPAVAIVAYLVAVVLAAVGLIR